jgi:hypothetical protein
MDYEKSLIVRFLYREEVAQAQIHRKVKAKCGANADSFRSVQRWCQFVRQRREDPDKDDR